MYTHDIDNKSGSVTCSPLWALSKYRQRQTGTICSGSVSSRWISPCFPPFKLRYVIRKPIENHTGNIISFFLVSLNSSTCQFGPVRSGFGQHRLRHSLGFGSDLVPFERAVRDVQGGGRDFAAAAAANQGLAQTKWAGLTD